MLLGLAIKKLLEVVIPFKIILMCFGAAWKMPKKFEELQGKPTEMLSSSDFLFSSHLCPPLMISQLLKCSVMVPYHFFLYHVSSSDTHELAIGLWIQYT